jgi:hypothetical protein
LNWEEKKSAQNEWGKWRTDVTVMHVKVIDANSYYANLLCARHSKNHKVLICLKVI